jgi:hypothetical protein
MIETDNQIFSFIMNTCLKEFELRPEIKTELLKPIVKNIIWFLLPYIAMFICINVLCVVTAMSFVLYFTQRHK